jgi:serine/threonine-protein kinase
MLTGRKAFTGEARASLISAILKDQPPPIAVAQPAAPAALEHVVRTCLAKHPEHRWQHAADVARQLTWIAETSTTIAAAGPDRRSMRRERIALDTVMALAAATLGWMAGRRAGGVDTPSSRPMHLTLTLEAKQPISRLDFTSTNDPHPSIALSPDGTRLAYAADLGGVSRLVVRDLSGSGSAPIAGTEGAVEPFFSPDGRWVGFWADRQLKKVALGGGAPVAIADAPVLRGAHWYASDSIVFVPNLYAAVWRVSASGGKPEQLTTVDAAHGERTHRWPEMLPGGRAILFTVGTGGSFDDARIVVQSLDTGERRTLVEGGSNPRYVPTGHVVYTRAGMLTAVPFDASPSRLQVTGPPAKLMDSVMTEGSGAAQYAFSASGSFASMPTVPDAEAALVWVDRAGNVTRLPGAPGAFGRIALAPDGHRVAIGTKMMDIRIRDLSRGTEWALAAAVWRSTVAGVDDGRNGTAHLVPGPLYPDRRQELFGEPRRQPILDASADRRCHAAGQTGRDHELVRRIRPRGGRQVIIRLIPPEPVPGCYNM